MVGILELTGTELDTGSEYELVDAGGAPDVEGEQKLWTHW